MSNFNPFVVPALIFIGVVSGICFIYIGVVLQRLQKQLKELSDKLDRQAPNLVAKQG